jgi:hypothetical protein
MGSIGKDQHSLFASEPTALTRSLQYALRRRLLVPAWWLEGLVFSLDRAIWATGSVHGGGDSALLVPQKMSAATVHSYAQFWHGIALDVLGDRVCSPGAPNRAVHEAVPGVFSASLSQIARGTVQQMLKQADDLQSHLMSPLEWQQTPDLPEVGVRSVVSGKPRRAPSKRKRHQKVAFVTGISRTEEDTDVSGEGARLHVAFRASLSDTFWGHLNRSLGLQPQMKLGTFDADRERPLSLAGEGRLVSLNPNVLQSLAGGHSKAGANRLVLYLWLELRKQLAFAPRGEGCIGGLLEPHLAHVFCSELMSKSSVLYDHGVLGWVDVPPLARLSELAARGVVSPAGPGVYQRVVLSESAEQVHAFECSLVDKAGSLGRTFDAGGKPLSEATLSEGHVLPVPKSLPQHLPSAGMLSGRADHSVAVVQPQPEAERPVLIDRGGHGDGRGLRERPQRGGAARSGTGVGRRRVGVLRRFGEPLVPPKAEDVPECPQIVPPRPRGVIRPATARLHPARLGDPVQFDRLQAGAAPDSSVRSGEIEYALRLAQYYESLGPVERAELDREMRVRSPHEFREFIGSRLPGGFDSRH